MTDVAALYFLFLGAITIFQTARFTDKTRKRCGNLESGKAAEEKIGTRGRSAEMGGSPNAVTKHKSNLKRH
jgi:hypothetical protein